GEARVHGRARAVRQVSRRRIRARRGTWNARLLRFDAERGDHLARSQNREGPTLRRPEALARPGAADGASGRGRAGLAGSGGGGPGTIGELIITASGFRTDPIAHVRSVRTLIHQQDSETIDRWRDVELWRRLAKAWQAQDPERRTEAD